MIVREMVDVEKKVVLKKRERGGWRVTTKVCGRAGRRRLGVVNPLTR